MAKLTLKELNRICPEGYFRFVSGYWFVNGEKKPGIGYLMCKEPTNDQKKEICKFENTHVGFVTYRHAPEMKYPMVFIED